jgi:ionotropic glutamate receptor
MLLWESGLLPFWVKGSIPRASKCFSKTNQRSVTSRQDPIILKDLTSAFFILGIGLGLATFAFLVEKIIYFRFRRTSLVIL